MAVAAANRPAVSTTNRPNLRMKMRILLRGPCDVDYANHADDAHCTAPCRGGCDSRRDRAWPVDSRTAKRGQPLHRNPERLGPPEDAVGGTRHPGQLEHDAGRRPPAGTV